MKNILNDRTHMLDTLRKVFGFREFRPNQEEIIRNILDKRDVFAVMPTGGGKSLCYQLPAKISKGTTVVISPLISLMKDQVDAAVENGISAAFINSSLVQAEAASVYRRLREGSLELLYVAPERFAVSGFYETLRSVPVSLFAIDEAHCISEWGHDFRPDYLGLSNITRLFPYVPVAAFTATATPRVQDDIIKKVGLRTPFTVRASFNRPNLFYSVRAKRGLEAEIMEFLVRHKGDPGIIYRTTRDSVTDLAALLNDNGVRALPYHAGLKQEERKANQEAFNRDEVTVMVATIAFGMGIDKSNVRFVIHADLPKNIEGYYQETGRAGRDGEPAECVLFFGRQDIPKIKYFIDQIQDEDGRAVALEKLEQSIKYASHNVCRRRQLLGYFGEQYEDANCGACDICTGTVEKVDITVDAQIVMSAVSRTGQRFGAGHIIDIVTGASTKRIRELGHESIKTYGAGSHRDKEHWRFIIDELFAQGAVCREGDKYPVIMLAQKGKDILFGSEKISALKREGPKKKQRSGAGDEFGPFDELLFERLRILRKGLADKQGVPPYIVFSDRTLHEMCRSYPSSLPELAGITGVGEAKLEHYGDIFINEIKAYLVENPGISVPEKPAYVPTAAPVRKKAKGVGETVEKTGGLFIGGLSIEQIAKERALSAATITGHIEQLIMEGRDMDMDRLVETAKRGEISGLFLALRSWQLAPVVEHFKGRVSYEEAKLVRAHMRSRALKEDLQDQA